MKLEGAPKAPVQIIVFGSGDPLAESEPLPQARRLPAPPPAALPEVTFDMEDLEMPPPPRS